MRRAVVVVLDGMRRDLIGEATTPALARFAARAQALPRTARCSPRRRASCRPRSRPAATPRGMSCRATRWRSWRMAASSITTPAIPISCSTSAAPPAGRWRCRRWRNGSRAHGGMILFSNVSPGAAYAHDPDGHGHVYHRAGSFAPGRKRIEGAQALDIAQDAAGERRMTERFVDEVLVERKPALAILWMGEPDATQHAAAAGLARASRRIAPGRCQCGARRRSRGPAARQGRRGAADRLLGPWASDGVAHRRRRGGAVGGGLEGEPRVRTTW